MLKLFQHQREIIDLDPKKCGLWLGTGSAKTAIALFLSRGKVLVICPKTQKEDRNWEREVGKWGMTVDLTVISKETFRRDAPKLPRFDTVIVDEADTCLGVTPNIRWKNKQPIPKTSQLFEALDLFIQRTKPDRLYLLTATITRNPMVVWGAGKLLGKGWDFYKWRDAFYFRLPMPGREAFSVKNDSDTKDRLAKAVQSLGYVGQLSSYFDVPEQSYKVIHLDLTTKQKQRIKELSVEYPDPLVLLGKKHQVENGVLTGNEFSKPEFFDNAKVDKILDLAIEFPKMVIFAKYTLQIQQIGGKLVQEGYKVLVLDGSTKDRGSLLLEANRAEKCILIAQSQISAGWEAPDFPVMVFASMSYAINDRIQGEGRILRANHLKKNLYIDLVCGEVDKAVADSIANKKDFSERIYLKL